MVSEPRQDNPAPVGIQPERKTGLRSTSIRASKQISEEALRQWLETVHSPLAGRTDEILFSPYWSTIIAITNAEESFYKNPICKATGKPSNNLYGMMNSGGTKAGIRCFDSILDGWNYMDQWFATREAKQPNIENYRARYCWAGYNESHICPEWEPRILKVKAEVENLN